MNNLSGEAPTNNCSEAICVGGDRPGSTRRIQHDGPSGAVFGRVGGYGVSVQAHFDDQLLRSLAILTTIHQEYYSIYEHSQLKLNSCHIMSDGVDPMNVEMRVEAVLSRMKSKILTGCRIVFSGVIPKNDPYPEHNFFWRLAKSMGAKVQ